MERAMITIEGAVDAATAAARLVALGLVDPTDRPKPREHRAAPRLATLNGKRAGFLDNHKANADVLLEEVQRLLAERFELAGETWVHKFIYSREATPAELDRLAEQCDFVVTAVGD
jgi:hypothetical protein